MIKFFRRIRQKLLAEKIFNKYLVYAIGEIILIVIGILIALQISNWNEIKKIRSSEQHYLLSLKTEFNFNKVELEKIMNRNNTNAEKQCSCGEITWKD